MSQYGNTTALAALLSADTQAGGEGGFERCGGGRGGGRGGGEGAEGEKDHVR